MRAHNDEFRLPEGIRGGLEGLFAPTGGMEARDAEILAAARRAGEAAMAGRRRFWRMLGAVGMAAAVALAAGIMWHQYSGRGAMPYARTGDIRDAFYLARQIQAHGAAGGGVGGKLALEGSWDANGDGVIDEKDVRILALAAVKVSGGASEPGGAKGVMR